MKQLVLGTIGGILLFLWFFVGSAGSVAHGKVVSVRPASSSGDVDLWEKLAPKPAADVVLTGGQPLSLTLARPLTVRIPQ